MDLGDLQQRFDGVSLGDWKSCQNAISADRLRDSTHGRRQRLRAQGKENGAPSTMGHVSMPGPNPMRALRRSWRVTE